MISQPSCVIRGRYEGVSESVALHQRCHIACVAKVVCVGPLGEGGAGSRLHGNDAEGLLGLATELLADEREAHACEIRSTPRAAHQNVGVISGHLHLFDGLR